jgi:hypothetical protein
VAASKGAEDNVYRAAKAGLTRWLARARTAVMAPFVNFKSTPSADAIFSANPAWQAEVDRILAALTPALREGWAAAHLPGDYDPDDSFVQANLALTQNLLVRIPDETHAMVIAQILEGANNGDSTEQIASRVDDVLTYTGSENWDSRARTIAQTECNRHWNGSILAHGLLVERQDGTPMSKTWVTQMDGKERTEHKAANNQTRPLGQPYNVGGEAMLFPGDPTAPPELVINCRCGQRIEKVAA